MSVFGVTVRVWPAGGPLYRTQIKLQDGSLYGKDREFDTKAAALLYCAQMLRVLADEESSA